MNWQSINWGDFIKDALIPAIAVIYTAVKAWKDIRAAKAVAVKVRSAEQEMIQQLLREKDTQHQAQVDFLQGQLDACLDDSRTTRPRGLSDLHINDNNE